MVTSQFQYALPYERKPYPPPKIDSEPFTPDSGINGTQAVCMVVMGGSAVFLAKTLHDTFKPR